MFKKLIQNPDWEFNLTGDVLLNGQKFIETLIADLLCIICNGVPKTARKKWFALSAHYELDVPQEHLDAVQYVKNESKVLKFRCGYQMFFNRKIEHANSYFFIPGLTRFAINEKGKVLSIKSGKILSERIGPYGYPYVNIYDPDKNDWRSVGVHILMARVFVPNNSLLKKVFVNHKDGNKLNYSPSNLEWVTSLENATHAVSIGLRSDNRSCKVRNIVTKEVLTFDSIGSFLRGINFKRKNISLTARNGSDIVPNIIAGKYEVKLQGDDTPWFYEDLPIFKNACEAGYQVLRAETQDVFECKTIREMVDLTSISHDRITSCLERDIPKLVNGWFFRIKTETPWPSEFSNVVFHKPKRIMLKNLLTGEEKIFESKRQAIAYLEIDKKTLMKRLAENKPVKNWILKLL